MTNENDTAPLDATPAPEHASTHIDASSSRILRFDTFISRFSPFDALAVGAILGLIALLWTHPNTAVIEDFWYHLALGHWIALKKEIFLTDPVSFQPFGRPQLYPLLEHILIAAGELVTRSAVVGSIVVRILVYVGNLAAVYIIGRKLASPAAGLLALILVGTEESVFYAGWSLMPAALIGLAIIVLVLLLERKHYITAGLVAGAAAYTHLALPWLVFLGIGLAAWSKRSERKGLMTTLVIGVACALPFLTFVALNANAFWAEKAVNFNPIPGLGPFGYASHYHIEALLAAFGGMGVAFLVLPGRAVLASFLGAGPVVAAALIGRDDFSPWLNTVLSPYGINVHPMTTLNIGSVVALLSITLLFILGVRRIAPSRSRAFDITLGAAGSLVFFAGTALAFHVEVLAYTLLDGLALALLTIVLVAAWAAVLWATPLARKPLALLGIALVLGAALAAAAAPSLTITLNPWTEIVTMALLVAGVGFAWILVGILRGVDGEAPLPPGATFILAFLLGLLPMLPMYGGRYTWHVAPALALAAVLHIRRDHPLIRRIPAPIALLLGGYMLMLLVVRWPLFAYSRGWRREFTPQSPPVMMALESGKAEYEEEDFKRMITWVKTYVPVGSVIHTDDPRTAHQVTVFADYVADNGMFWEAQTQQLQDLVAAERAKGKGAFVYTGELPPSVTSFETIGKWKVAWIE